MFTSIIKELLETKIAEYNETLPNINRWWIWNSNYEYISSERIIGSISGNINIISIWIAL